MQQEQQAHVLMASLLIKMGKSDQEIRSTFEAKGLSSVDVEKLLVLTKTTLQEIEKDTEEERIRYANELDDDKIEELVQKVTEWYVNGDPNHYQISQNLKHIGVDEKYHEEIRLEAHERVRRATHRQANLKIAVGVVVAIVGLFIVMLALGTTGGGRGAVRILVAPFVAGLAIIAWGLAQKNAI